ncbi:hypothetical protein EDD16DRAFT_1881987 [Pisolithus croceorrhizus]|nr:hypothetical protein EDD16DRAFT_1881987 [Pisolithus croceorrhizus]
MTNPQAYEDQHVHAVYNHIAPHFSSTRYKVLGPSSPHFSIRCLRDGLASDSGTGNGKYLPFPTERPGSVLTIGMDRSWNLLQIAKHAGSGPGLSATREVVRGDVLENGWRDGVLRELDYAISIATIHHLASHQRRKLAVQRLLQCVSPVHGRVLIYVWAVEQDNLSKRSVPISEGDGSSGQDVFVPWVMSQQTTTRIKTREPAAETAMDVSVYNRYYHMFAKGELTKLVKEAAEGMGSGCDVIRDGWERSNYYIELRRWIS